MHRLLSLYLLFIFLLLTQGCNPGEKKKVFLDETEANALYYRELVDSVKIIPCESDNQAFLVKDGFYATAYCAKMFFVLDRLRDHSIHVYNYSGKVVDKLYRQGEGEGEYAMAYDLLVDEQADLLVVLDPTGKIIRYSLSEGFSFVDEFCFVDYLPAAHNICKVSSGVYALFSRSAEYQLYICSFHDRTVKPIRYSVPEWLLFSPYMVAQSPFYTYNGDAFFFDQLVGDIFQITENRMRPYLRWGFGEYSIKESMLPPDKMPNYYMELLNKSSYRFATQFTAAQETDRFVFMRFTFRNQLTVLVYDKQEDTVRTFCHTVEGLQFTPGTLLGNSMYLLIHRDYISRYVPKELITIDLPENFVILEYKLK